MADVKQTPFVTVPIVGGEPQAYTGQGQGHGQRYHANTNTSTSSNAVGCCAMSCIGMCTGMIVILALVLMFALPSAEIHIATNYASQVTCESSVGVSFKAWLLVKGIVGILSVPTALVIVLTMALGKAAMDKIPLIGILLLLSSSFVLWIISAFNFAWLIIGAVIFWRDCKNLDPLEVNNMMWASLIIGFVFLAMNVCSGRKARSDEQR
jgi:hypothetical protein